MAKDACSKKSKEIGGITHLSTTLKGGGCSSSKTPTDTKSGKSSDKFSTPVSKSVFYAPVPDYEPAENSPEVCTGSASGGASVGSGTAYDYGSSGSVKKSSPRFDHSPNRQRLDYEEKDSGSVPLDAVAAALAEVNLNHSPNSSGMSVAQRRPPDNNMLGHGSSDYAGSSISSGYQQSQYRDSRGFDVGDRVFIQLRDTKVNGVVRYVGPPPQSPGKGDVVLGLEMDEPNDSFTDGTLKGARYFKCPANKGLLILSKYCESQFQDFGGQKCPVVSGRVEPISTKADIMELYGRDKGIQGHYNSCYLDATLFSMFAFNSGFDSLLYRTPNMKVDIPEYEKVQEILRDKIVNPLRKNKYVRADRLMELRELLELLSSVSGLTCEEKDPEEFLVLLLQQILKAQPFLKLSSSQESYYYQLFVEKNEKVSLPTVQYLLEQSFHSSNVKLKEVPAALVVLMPRFGKSFKVYPRIVPTPQLEVTDIIENSPRICSLCGCKTAFTECIECFLHKSTDPHNRLCAFCKECDELIHKPTSECQSHKRTHLVLPPDFEALRETVQPIYMDLFAVVCIETSHYVSFVKCGSDPVAPWCFFDSMADRVGEQDGYNIPVVEECPDLEKWLSDESYSDLKNFFDGDRRNPPPNYVRRLLTDVYLCMYRHREVAKYQ